MFTLFVIFGRLRSVMVIRFDFLRASLLPSWYAVKVMSLNQFNFLRIIFILQSPLEIFLHLLRYNWTISHQYIWGNKFACAEEKHFNITSADWSLHIAYPFDVPL